MFTASVLSSINNPELRRTLHLEEDDKEPETQVAWIKTNFPCCDDDDREFGPDPENGSLQQSDLLRKFYLTIAKSGLLCTYKQAGTILDPSDLPKPAVNCPEVPEKRSNNQDKHVIIVGAGMSGLVAAYELKKAGYSVDILEMSQRYGGRVKTLSQKDGYDRGLHTDAGAMRLPLPPKKDRPVREMIHYLTDYYAETKFRLKPVPFSNQSENAFYNFYGECTKISEWKDSQFCDYWPGWDLLAKKQGITNLITYYEVTVKCVKQLLKNRLDSVPRTDIKAQAEQWDLWTNNWCQFSFGSFLRNTLEGIKTVLVFDDKVKKNDKTLNELEKYLPWPEIAIAGYGVFNYTLSQDVSLVSVLQDEMGKYCSPKMHSLEGGLSALPNAFAGEGKVEPLITYNRTVMKVEYKGSGASKSVKVSGVVTSSSQPFSVEGRSVILTVPLHILRGIQIVNIGSCSKNDFPRDFQQAIEDITYTPSTKIMLQYKKQFWNTGKSSETDITGGFSKTNMPIGQLHYPTEVKVIPEPGIPGGGDWIDAPVNEDQKGILMVYTWKSEALLWGALTEEQAIMLAVQQIDEIHPETDTKALFQMGKRQAWASDPTTLGAFAMLRPREYISVMYLMQQTWRNVYFGGEAISFTNGWIQGALESGLRAAYQLFSDDQPKAHN